MSHFKVQNRELLNSIKFFLGPDNSDSDLDVGDDIFVRNPDIIIENDSDKETDEVNDEFISDEKSNFNQNPLIKEIESDSDIEDESEN